MAIRERNNLKNWFQTGKYPTQDQFWDWLDSFVHKTEDKLDIDSMTGLRSLVDSKADQESYLILYQQVQAMTASRAKIVRPDVLSPLSDDQLNAQYPAALPGAQVICPLITGGGELYEKFDQEGNRWFRLYMTKGIVSNPGAMAAFEIDYFV
ncbi:hypothetical protein F0L74_00870 [Chitinophaga agrisoli]|uniref:Uncharacterized protein n=1 Tax=Chitinophaga agrisoli TaxID=2607653 RepID=A0A5B2W1B0_9BACT|nr:hypothetical protein [Chitinophaga agrisoli]KAA2244560.1 hypothetical protein F0L74_00870 [Chitinophaga agrisoli]